LRQVLMAPRRRLPDSEGEGSAVPPEDLVVHLTHPERDRRAEGQGDPGELPEHQPLAPLRARATTLQDIGTLAFPALARALDACPSFLAESAAGFVESTVLAGEHREELPGYLRQFASEDPLIRVAVSVPRR
jgi:hypothetical protein